MERSTLNANERIKNSIEITTLIRKGQAFFIAPYKVHYIWEEKSSHQHPVRVAFAVPKRKFAKAVNRNRLKRLSREAYRTQKESISTFARSKNLHLRLLFVYQKTSKFTYAAVQESMKNCFAEIIKKHG